MKQTHHYSENETKKCCQKLQSITKWTCTNNSQMHDHYKFNSQQVPVLDLVLMSSWMDNPYLVAVQKFKVLDN